MVLTNCMRPITFSAREDAMNTIFAIILIIDHGTAPGT